MRSKLIVILLLLLATSSCDREKDLASSGGPKTIILTRGQKSTQRPRAPERQQIEVAYSGLELIFRFEIPEGSCRLTLTETATGYTQTFEFNSDALVYSLPIKLQAPTQISLSTATGKVYFGSIE